MLGLAVVVTILADVRERRWALAIDLVALVVAFAVVTPLVAFAAFFGLWHAWRQTALLIPSDVQTRGVSGRAAATQFVRQSALPTVPSLIALGVVVAFGGRSVQTYLLAAVLCLTVPHAAASALAARRLRLGVGQLRPATRPAP